MGESSNIERTAGNVWTEAKIIDFLVDEGCRFHPREKPLPDIPEIDAARAMKLFDNISSESLASSLDIIMNFLYGVPITDKFGKDKIIDEGCFSSRRRVWRNSLRPEVKKYYDDNNQLRGQNITYVLGYLGVLVERCVDEELKEALTGNFKKYIDFFPQPISFNSEGNPCFKRNPKEFKRYDQLPDRGKIAFVRQLEESVVEVLQTIAKFTEQGNLEPQLSTQ